MKAPRLQYPLKNKHRISLGFGEIPAGEEIKKKFAQWGWKGHQGIDFVCPEGTEVLAVDEGKIILAKMNGDYGNCVIIQHRWGTSLYAHLKEIRVGPEETVRKGALLGLSGRTGATFGAHLHLEVRIGNSLADPLPLFLPNDLVVNNPVVRDSKTKNSQK